MASVAGPRPACGVHPSSSVVPGPAVQPVRCPARPVSSPSGVQPVRCPVTWVRRPGSVVRGPSSGVRRSGVHPSSVQPSGVHPARPDASVSSHVRRWRWEPGRCGRGTAPRERARSLWAAAPSSGSGVGRGGLEAGDAAEIASVGGGVGGDLAGLCAGGGACPLTDQAGPAGVLSARGWRLRCGHGSKPQREVAVPAAWLPSWAGCATTVGGGRGG
jgi:hypothetical protein